MKKHFNIRNIVIAILAIWVIGSIAFKDNDTSAYDPIKFYNRVGAFRKPMKVFIDSFPVSSASGGSLDISGASFSVISSISAVAMKNTGTSTSVSNVGIKSYTNSAVVLNCTEGNGSLVTILGSGVLLGPSTAFASTTGLYIHLMVIGY